MKKVRIASGQEIWVIETQIPFSPTCFNQMVAVAKAVSSGTEAVYARNQSGAWADKIYDGTGVIVDRDDIVAVYGFDEAPKAEDVELASNPAVITTPESYLNLTEMRYKACVKGVRHYAHEIGVEGILVGVSGGLDSALAMSIAVDAVGADNVLGVYLPTNYNSKESQKDAQDLMHNTKSKEENYREIPLEFLEDLAVQIGLPQSGIAYENMQARYRGLLLMGISNHLNYLVLSPSNKSESAVGYFTLYGDSVGGYAPLIDAYKTEVFDMARWRFSQPNTIIPLHSIERPPSAELSMDQKDEDNLPPYEILDAILYDFIENGQNGKMLVKKYGEVALDVIKKYRRAEWKRRQTPIGPKLSVRTIKDNSKFFDIFGNDNTGDLL